MQSLQNPLDLECLHGFDHDRFGVLARTLQVLLGHGRVDYAVAAVRQFAKQTRRQPVTPGSLLVDVVGVRLANALEGIGCTTVGAFVRLSDAQICSIPNMAEGAVAVRDRLRAELATGKLVEDWNTEGLEFDFLDAEIPREVLQFVEREMSVGTSPSQMSVFDALKLVSENREKASQEIEKRIVALEDEIDQLKSMQKLLGGQAKPKTTNKPMQLTDEHLATATKMIKALTDAKAALPPAQLATKVGQHFALVGRIAKADSRFMRYDDGRIGLA